MLIVRWNSVLGPDNFNQVSQLLNRTLGDVWEVEESFIVQPSTLYGKMLSNSGLHSLTLDARLCLLMNVIRHGPRTVGEHCDPGASVSNR